MRPINAEVVTLLSVVVSLLVACSPPEAPATIAKELEPGNAVSTTHGPRETASYVFDAKPGHSYLVRVGQNNADMVVDIEDATGNSITVDTRLAGANPKFALLDSSHAATYKIFVSSRESSEPEISHNILVSDLGEAFAKNETLVEAARLMSSATVSYWIIWDWYQAADTAAKAAELYASAGYPGMRADSIMFQAAALAETIYSVQDREQVLEKIAELLDESYETHLKLGNFTQLAKVRYYNGLALQYAGQNDLARSFYKESLLLYEKVDDWREERNIHLNLAVMEITSGNSATAIQSLVELLSIDDDKMSGLSDKNFIAAVQDQLGFAYADIGDIDAALWAYFSAAEKHADAGDQHGAAESLRGLALTYLSAGDIDAAKQFVDRARVAAQESSNGRILSGLISMLGDMLYTTGSYESARDFQIEALNMTAPGSAVRTDRQVALARTLNALQDHEGADDIAGAALRAARAVDALLSEAGALHEIGIAKFGLGNHTQSIAALEEALELYGVLGRSAEQADTAFALAQSLIGLASASDDALSRTALFERAEIESEKALQHVEWAIAKVSDPELRSRLASTRRRYFHSHIEFLMDRFEESGRKNRQLVSAALATSEQARARMTMHLLNEASVDLQESVDSGTAEEMHALRKRLTILERQRDELQESGAADGETRARLAYLREEIANIRVQYDLKQVALRQGHEAYRALAAPETISIDEIQDLVDEDSVVVQYFLGEQRSFAWVVAHDSLEVVQLTDRATIEEAAERAFSTLSSHGFQRKNRVAQSQAIRDVSEMVLRPLATFIGDRRLIVVADGALHYLPFQALSALSGDGFQQLIQSHEVVALPSMSVLASLRARKTVTSRQKSVAVFADPVFATSDPRYVELANNRNDSANELQDSSNSELRTGVSGGAQFSRLAGTRVEAKAISELVPDDKLLLLTGFAANRHSALDRDLSEYRYVHFATHGDVNRESPELSSLILSQFDANGKPQDGHLWLHDIYRLNIGADLVILSACRTGAGTDIDGEGLIGLAQGFFYAGARSMIVSLWDVPDKPTGELMKRFYYEVLENGRTPVAALRAAQVAVAADPRWEDPYYWSAFVLLGDWQ